MSHQSDPVGRPALQRVLVQRDLHQYDGLAETRRDELIAEGRYPAPLKLSNRRKGWLECEILAWQRERIAERDRALAQEAANDPPNSKRWQPPSA